MELTDKEKKAIYNRTYRLKTKEKMKEYYEKNKKHILEQQKLYRKLKMKS